MQCQKKAKTPVVLAIREGKIQKYEKNLQGANDKAKGKNKLAYAPKTKIPLPPKRENSAKDPICHHCKEVGHWRRNCPSYHAELKKRKNASEASNSGIFTIELYAISNNTWVYDTSYGNHICNTSQGLRRSRKLKHGALSLYMGNGMRAAVEAITNFDLIIPSGLITVLDNCYFAPTVTRGVVSISCLVKNGYTHTFMNYGISVSKDNVDPFRTMSREGANYFITFTDDVSRYGFVYLMKHKYEVFETFKVFQNEVEKQFGKKIMAIRSDRGGEYLSHEFVNHMKSYGIVYQLTPPYTPQHNGVSERRNRTLLDMVRSMMNLTTLPKSFWGYALKTAARILNMVPTKKVDRMPYEIWHGKAPNLSYLRVLGYEDWTGAVTDINEDGFCHPIVTIPLLPDFGGVTDGTRAKNPSSLSDIHARVFPDPYLLFRLIMPPKRFKKKSVRKIVEKRVAKAIKKYEKTRADSNKVGRYGSTNTGGTGTEGVVGLKRWFEKMEQVFEICKCAEDDKVKFVMCTFEGRALTWWNRNVQTLGLPNANQIPWSNVKAMMTTEYCPSTEIQRMEQELWESGL
ncbi:retrotransposon protein, putative, ty1-copia subclass [Tanacetum coccineum]